MLQLFVCAAVVLVTSVVVAAGFCLHAERTGGFAVALPEAGSPNIQNREPQPERHLTNLRQLTSGGENAEAYFSPDGTRLIYQSTRPEYPCDQIYTMKVDGTDVRRVSTGTGRTTCGYFYPGGAGILFASTHEASTACPPRPSFARGYVWPIYAGYDIYRANADGSKLTPITREDGYDAEATIAPDGLIVFTSVRDGDMEIYTMRGDGSDVKRLTSRPGPDGGPFFSWDGKRIVFRGRSPGPGKEMDDYRSLLKEGLWRPTSLELFVMDRDGSNLRQVTKLGGANFAPSWHPDGKRLIFASNTHDPKGRNFDLYLIDVDGTGLERLTFNDTFDGFPMFSPDGKKLVFASNRGAKAEGETNVFIADWIQ
jgi:TolB protein